MENLPYDRTNAEAIEAYGQKLIGMTFNEVIELCAGGASDREEMVMTYVLNHYIAKKDDGSETLVKSPGTLKENMSFSPFKFKDFAKETFEDSELFKFFDETRLFFVVWKKHGSEYRLVGCRLWNMPYADLEHTVREGWEQIQQVVRYGVKLDRSGSRVTNNLPKKGDNEIIHIRPHAKKAAYRFADGTEYGNVERDANELPGGEFMTTQSFWINNSYIIKQLDCLKTDG